jgi:hypothetical protein
MSSWIREVSTTPYVKRPVEPMPTLTNSIEPVSVNTEVNAYPMPEFSKKKNERSVPFYEIQTKISPPEVRTGFSETKTTEPESRGERSKKTFYDINAITPKPERQTRVQQQQQQKQPVVRPILPPSVQMKQIPRPSAPTVTVLIPLYNGLEFIEGSLESVRRQTYKNWVGVIGVNGHGETGEPIVSKLKELVNSLGMTDVFEVINLPDAKGAAATITLLAKNHSTTQYVAHLDCDDIWLPKKLETQVKKLESEPTIDIVGTMCRYFGDSSDIPTLPAGELRKSDFEKTNPLIHSSIMIRRELANYTDEFVAYDYDCWVRNIINDAKITNIDTILVFHRIHSKSFFNASNKQDPEAVREKYNLA